LTTNLHKDPSLSIQSISVARDCLELPYTREILNRAGDLPINIVTDSEPAQLSAAPYPQGLTQGKKHLLLCMNRGRFFKPCPGTREYHCCDYQVLNIGMNCPMDCVYCILQAYLNNPWLSFFVNVEDLLDELRGAFDQAPERFWRIGTGEFTDSLALDRLTGLSTILVEFMKDKQNAVLELKTKTAMIDNLIDLDHGGRTIVSWSLNSPAIMAREELRTASLDQRLQAAAECAAAGYKLAFHFDPIIYHQGWQEGYATTINKLFGMVPAEQIVWISLGALRYLPALRPIATNRFPNSRFFHEEFIMGLDGKYRYFRSLRVKLYRFILEQLTKFVADHTCIYLCMESTEIWREAGLATDPGDLPALLDKAAGSFIS